MENKSKIILVGLWNPQLKYINTRHNIGADILFSYCQKNNQNLTLDDSGKYQSCKFDLDGKQIMVVIPMTSMNNSGQGLKTFLLENELKDYELFVVHDLSLIHI